MTSIASKYTIADLEAIQKEANKRLGAIHMVYFPDQERPYLSMGAVRAVLEAAESVEQERVEAINGFLDRQNAKR